ncbi:4-hydroxybutyrate dehydrogenase [Falsiporphyromonas endometrii]|uniref:4-hydroxybutyrate dehydrogenase n=1 Tax=Falsiporphyromonas endometrii TaxID=1387297 RepID=A0ABV9K5C5_9PORP|nr:4-hydroxybutyrate dehydrogenase [Porphyromonadaceae bacterium]
MQLFKLGSVIHSFDSFADFAQEFKLGERDLVITNDFLFKPFMEKLNLPCKFIMQEKYGLGEPNDEMMNAILRDTKGTEFDRVIAVGGGTVIDISKLFVLKGLGDNVLPAFDHEIPLIKEKKLVIIPTTSGTGSEVTNISIAEIKSRHTKMGLADDAILADDAVIIPEFLRGLPFRFWAASSIDALIHAVESYVSPKANMYTRMCSCTAMDTILDVFKGVATYGEEYRYERLGDMLMAANIAGIAFGNAGVGAVHALSYPLGGNYHVPHGESNYQFFTTVFKAYLAKKPQGSIQEVNKRIANALQCTEDNVYECLDALLGKLIQKKPLREYGMKEEEVRGFAESVMVTQQRLLKNNYVDLTVDEIEAIYRSLY